MIVIIIALTTLPLLALHRRRIRSELGIISFTIKNSLKLRQAAATANAHVIAIRESLAVQVSLVGTMIIIIFIAGIRENKNKVGS